MVNELVIITGVTGFLGKAYVSQYANNRENRDTLQIVGISRVAPKIKNRFVKYCQIDLLDSKTTQSCIQNIDLSGIDKIVYIHPVGKFKFESDFQELDSVVCSSNVDTFKNIAEPLINRINQSKTKLCLVAFGSISDSFNVPFWRSYSYSKNVLRKYVQQKVAENEQVSGCFFNLSSVRTENESRLRPFANTQYWLSPEEIVTRSVNRISFDSNWSEFDIFNAAPNYSSDLYSNHVELLARWEKEMSGKSS
ncbi:hypothetical protein HN587_05445 [Candidatus Woesearchaeota archaeon]|jgi:short-subunit dehydrogenase|nr:hypothetical protein [Candidatus Woesearchaeota archaeon]